MLHRVRTWNWLFLCLSVLSACSAFAPAELTVGMSRDEVVARMGQPEMERPMKAGSRLEFPGGPFGRQTWFVYFDAAGKVSSAEQVLTEQNFSLVNAGMTQDEVRQLLGRPGEWRTLGRSRGVVWSYRYENNFCRWFQVELSLQQQVRSAGYGELPECDRRTDRNVH